MSDLRRRKSVAGEDERRFDRRGEVGAEVDRHVGSELEHVLFAVTRKAHTRFVLENASLSKSHVLKETRSRPASGPPSRNENDLYAAALR